ncbi:hypothetical protein BC793_111295 [Actinoplanes xinjiangensis]|uniref:NACHT domain-containing protein n=2 Tax=Actinoplanes xinjiangensis TaxID=512350 RepID=A0A316FV93_9ACTN|nr:hypothetical protein BC793_111295 [Actinoplanes xinjiangensis]GIF41344.1 hypothetical protein Axi01nite_56550 [Actinoplanes xinjiangensis]
MRTDRGGVGNELGSVHRKGLAAFLAAHGLAGRRIALGDATTFVPQRLAFETGDYTDDITCTASTGARMFISAKHATGNDEKNLGKTVQGWVDQETQLLPGDVLALAVNRFDSKEVEQLPAAVKGHRGSPGTPLLVNTAKALTALKNKIAKKSGDTAVQRRVLDAAFVLQVKVMGPGDDGWELAAALLETGVVAPGHGLAAVGALAEAFHTQASLANASDLGGWIDILREAKIPLVATPGTPGSEEYARQIALEAYQDILAAAADQISLGLLGEEDLRVLTVPQLADGLRVAIPPQGNRRAKPAALLAIARRWPRLLLTALPGMGKTTALEQIAAHWSADDAAPTPVLVELPKLLGRCAHSRDVTLSVLCEVAASITPAEQRSAAAAALERACRDGHAVLLLDGFDECGRLRPVLADGLVEVLARLPDDVGVLLATRAIGVEASRRLGLIAVELTTPRNLGEALHRLLEHIAQIRDIASQYQPAWVATRAERLRIARRDHPDIIKVPLLATLMTIVAANSTDVGTTLEQGRAHLLLTAVRDSVLQWEDNRPKTDAGHAQQPDPDQLLDGFAALGRLLAPGAPVPGTAATAEITSMLASRWGVRAPAAATALAGHILRFWDQNVGVFVTAADGTIAARSRVFAEIGAAMAIAWLTADELTAWVDGAVADADQHVALILAGEADPRVIGVLLTADRSTEASALIAATIVRHGAAADHGALSTLIDRLAPAAAGVTSAGSASQQITDPDTGGPADAWTYARQIAGLRVPAALRDHRTVTTNWLTVTAEQQTVAAALIALADAAADGAHLNSHQAQSVRSALLLPLAPELPGTASPEPLPGHIQVGIDAVAHLHELGTDLITPIVELTGRGTLGMAEEVEEALISHGHQPRQFRSMQALGEQIAASFKPYHVDQFPTAELTLLQNAAALADTDGRGLTANQRWRLPQLCTLFTLIDFAGATVGGLGSALAETPDSVRTGWLRVTATVAGLDPGVVAAEAKAAIAERGEHSNPGVRRLLTAAPLGPTPVGAAHEFDFQDRADALAALVSASSWIARSLCRILIPLRDGLLSDQIAEQIETGQLTAARRTLLAYVACRLSREPETTARRLLTSDDPALHTGVQQYRTEKVPA